MEISKNAYSEVYAIINLMSLNLRNKIPENILKNIDDKRDKSNNVKISDINKYIISDDANKLLAVLYKNYYATEEEKEIIDVKEKCMFQKEQTKLRQKYNPDDLFKKNDNLQNNFNEVNENVQLVEYKEQKWYQKIFDRILSIFKKN